MSISEDFSAPDLPQAPRRNGRRREQREHIEREEAIIERSRPGRIVVEAGGKIYTRKRVGNTDPFAIPPHIIPEGWSYQWNVISVTGQAAVDAQIQMAENGWEPVPSGRHKGMFMPADYPPGEPIIRGGLRLECRPKVLTEEAMEEDRRSAIDLIHDRDRELGMGTNPRYNLGRGHEHVNFARNGRAAVSKSVDYGGDIPRSHVDTAE